jgi:intermediate peptidase
MWLHVSDTSWQWAPHLSRCSDTNPHDVSLTPPRSAAASHRSILCVELFGMQLRPVPRNNLQGSESWHDTAEGGVQKMELVHETEGLMGVIYFDLYPRPGSKFTHAAHFTLRCGRQLRAQELLQEEQQGRGGEAGGSGKYQTPIVALVTNFSSSGGVGGQPVLSHSEFETLLHEFGHALHSLLSRTEFQVRQRGHGIIPGQTERARHHFGPIPILLCLLLF